MSVRIADGVIHLEGVCTVEQAEPLLIALQREPEASVDIAGLTGAHLAVIQVLLAAQPKLIGVPGNDFLKTFILHGLIKGIAP